jgi:hypothetical protein
VPQGRTLPTSPQVTLKMRLPVGSFPTYPVRMILPDERLYKMQHDDPGGRFLYRSPFEFAQGSVEIGGKPVRTLFMFDPGRGGSAVAVHSNPRLWVW